MIDDKDIIKKISDIRISRNPITTLFHLNKNQIKKKKKRRIIIVGEDEEVKDYYDDYNYEILMFPQGSNPPNPNNKPTLCVQPMVINQLF
jgi:hypothetical protein